MDNILYHVVDVKIKWIAIQKLTYVYVCIFTYVS